MIVLVLGGFVSYNTFVRQRHTIEESWRQIDVELQRRHDLISNLVETARIAAGFEQQALLAVLNARAAAMHGRHAHDVGHARQGELEAQLSTTVRGFFGLAENYPQLRSNQNFAQLQYQLAETENRIAAGRRFYNGNVRQYNARLETVPSNMIAALCSFETMEYFVVADEQVGATPQIRGLWQANQPPQPGQLFPPAH
ncbi:LemA family protein [Nocardia sp. NPDC051832]|uniref:LemA family protein n=1 Tax=Nocardia sp. NPDC051832 TaxID=3155673 RepID=UPI00341DA0EF